MGRHTCRSFNGVESKVQIKYNSHAFDWQETVENLKYIDVNTLSNDDCRKRHENVRFYRPAVHDFSHLCAFSGQVGMGTCIGDTGGALVHENRLIGIGSWRVVGRSDCANG